MPQTQNSANLRTTIDSVPVNTAVKETVTYDQRNSTALDYIINVSYDPSDYTYSSIGTYASATTAYNKSRPSGAAVTLPSSGTMTVQDGARSMSYAVSSGQNTIYNITPGGTGSFVVKNSNDEIISAGLLKPTGNLRMINAPATNNVRDLGGWTCDGGTVKYGMLFRGGEPGANDATLFHDLLGIRAELNLRWEGEVEHNYSIIGSDVDFKHVCGPWYSIGESVNWPADAHKQILDYVMDNVIAGNPVYFHCAAGADRTGTVAFFLEALLGMSQSDMDKEYELTCFYSGVATDAAARRRDEDEWKNFMTQFSSFTGSTMRDKAVNWVLSLGITIEKINAFRTAMINGTPSTLSGAGTVTVTRSLTGASTSNTSSSNTKYQPYTTNITPDTGKVITSVQVTMGGTDITNEVFSGTKTVFKRSVTRTLVNCTINNLRNAVIDGQGYGAVITPDNGYTLEGATVSITIGGIDMSNYYNDGVIAIPRVTGDLVISITAASSAPEYITLTYKNGYNCGYTVGSSVDVGTNASYFITEAFPVTPGVTYTINVTTSTSSGFRFIGVDGNGDNATVTEATQVTYSHGSPSSFSWTPSAGTTFGRLRGYASEVSYMATELYISE